MSPTWILARMTFREAIRRRIVLTGLVLGSLFLIVYSVGTAMVLQQASNLTNLNNPTVSSVVRTEGVNTLALAGLYAATFLAIAMAALLGADTLAGEINSGTVQSLVTKPIRRTHVVLGKWLGYAGLLGAYTLLMAGGVLLSVRLISGYLPPNPLAGLILIYMESLLVLSVAILWSSMLSGLATGGVVFGLYGLAFIGGWVEQIGSVLNNQTAVNIGILTSLIIPSEALWRRAAFEMQSPIAGALGMSPFGASSAPSTLMIVYAVAYAVLTLYLAVRTFNQRDL